MGWVAAVGYLWLLLLLSFWMLLWKLGLGLQGMLTSICGVLTRLCLLTGCCTGFLSCFGGSCLAPFARPWIHMQIVALIDFCGGLFPLATDCRSGCHRN